MLETQSLVDTTRAVVREATHLTQRSQMALVNTIVVFVNCRFQVARTKELAECLRISDRRVKQIKHEVLKYELLNPVTRNLIHMVTDRWADRDRRRNEAERILRESELQLAETTVQRILDLLIPIV